MNMRECTHEITVHFFRGRSRAKDRAPLNTGVKYKNKTYWQENRINSVSVTYMEVLMPQAHGAHERPVDVYSPFVMLSLWFDHGFPLRKALPGCEAAVAQK